MKFMKLNVERLEENRMKFSAENASPRVTKENIKSLSKNRLRPKRLTRATKKLSPDIDVQILGIDILLKSVFSASCVKKVAELQYFSRQPRLNCCFM